MSKLEIRYEHTEGRNKRTIPFDGITDNTLATLISPLAKKKPITLRNTEFLGVGNDGRVYLREEKSQGTVYSFPEGVFLELVDKHYS